MRDLFGQEYRETDLLPTSKTLIQKKLGKYNYRKAENEVERCKYCKRSFRSGHHGKGYWKCEVVGCSRSDATDIRANNVCDLFEKED